MRQLRAYKVPEKYARQKQNYGDLREKSSYDNSSLLAFCAILLSESVEKSKFGCIVCKKKSRLRPFQRAKAYANDLESCFGIRAAIDDDKLIICEACRRALQEH